MMTEHQLTQMVLRVMRQQLEEKLRQPSPQGREGLPLSTWSRKQQQGTTDTISQSLEEIEIKKTVRRR